MSPGARAYRTREGDARKQEGYGEKRGGVAGRNAVEQAGHQTRQTKCRDQSHTQAGECKQKALANHHAQQLFRAWRPTPCECRSHGYVARQNRRSRRKPQSPPATARGPRNPQAAVCSGEAAPARRLPPGRGLAISATDWSLSNWWTCSRTEAARLRGSEDVRTANSMFPATPPSTPWACGENTCGKRGSVRLSSAASPTTPTTVSHGPFEQSSPMQIRLPMGSTSEKKRRASVALTITTFGLWSLLSCSVNARPLQEGNTHGGKIAGRDLSEAHNGNRFPGRGGAALDVQSSPEPAVRDFLAAESWWRPRLSLRAERERARAAAGKSPRSGGPDTSMTAAKSGTSAPSPD